LGCRTPRRNDTLRLGPGTWLRASAASAVAAAALVGVAGAERSVSFPDRAGDAGRAVDITRLDVSDSGYGLSFWVAAKGRFRCNDGDGVPIVVAIDTDENPDTGSAFYGTEFELAPDAIGESIFRRAHGWDFKGVPRPDGLGWGCGPGTAGYAISAAALGLSPGDGFNVVVAALGPHTDTAPDIRTFNYQRVPGTAARTPGPDRRAPHLVAYGSRAMHGSVAVMRYWVLDGRGRTADTIRIYRGVRLLKTIRRPLRDSNPFFVSHFTWRVPDKIRGRLRFSVRAVDAAGNASKLTWARLDVR
jgi:hypothetical protein